MIYNIIDDVLPEELSNEIHDVMLGPDFTWYYSPDIAVPNEYVDYLFYMTHNFYCDHRPNCEHFDRWFNTFQNILKCNALLRMKGNLYPSQRELTVHPKHIDMPKVKNVGAIYYVNDNDGFTIIGDEKIASKKNRLLIFDAHTPHSSTDCTNTHCRVNINFNYLGYGQ